MDIFKKQHVHAMIVIAAMLGAFMWPERKFTAIEKRLVRIETALSLKGVFPEEYAARESDVPIKNAEKIP